MKIAIILNGISRNKKFFYKTIYPKLARNFSVEVFETQHSGHAEALATQSVLQKVDIIIAAGGDGTLNQVINGILKSNSELRPTVGLIPLGSGNDFARTCGISARGVSQLLKTNQPKSTDVGEISCTDAENNKITRYFINVCSLGMGPEVVKRLVNSKRIFGPSISYLTSILSVFFSHKPQVVHVKTSAWEWRDAARVVAIANGKTFGHSIYIAPDASPEDGTLNTFIAGALPLWKFLYSLQLIKNKRKVSDPMFHYGLATAVSLTSPETCFVEAEGEMAGLLPASVKILPGRIMFLR